MRGGPGESRDFASQGPAPLEDRAHSMPHNRRRSSVPGSADERELVAQEGCCVHRLAVVALALTPLLWSGYVSKTGAGIEFCDAVPASDVRVNRSVSVQCVILEACRPLSGHCCRRHTSAACSRVTRCADSDRSVAALFVFSGLH